MTGLIMLRCYTAEYHDLEFHDFIVIVTKSNAMRE